jgi:hypothetical protein
MVTGKLHERPIDRELDYNGNRASMVTGKLHEVVSPLWHKTNNCCVEDRTNRRMRVCKKKKHKMGWAAMIRYNFTSNVVTLAMFVCTNIITVTHIRKELTPLRHSYGTMAALVLQKADFNLIFQIVGSLNAKPA